MRTNLPVTHNEFVVPDGVTLVSTTDLQSRITYCNPNFVAVSGYSREELIGQPHNLVRHPDMPPEAFRDMWATLQSGSPWSALVKNRRKNGDHYWVMANATPIVQNGQPVGYMSVRTKPTREQIESAETARPWAARWARSRSRWRFSCKPSKAPPKASPMPFTTRRLAPPPCWPSRPPPSCAA